MAFPETRDQNDCPAAIKPKYRVGQIVVMTSMKAELPFRILDVQLIDGDWAYAFTKKNYVGEDMIRPVRPEELANE